MSPWLAVIIITVLAVISPGPDFAMVTRLSYARGRRAGLACALGIACGVQVHVLYSVLGVTVLMARLPWLFTVMKWAGAAYLVYLGTQALTSQPASARPDATSQRLSLLTAWRTGLLTNALNPKTMLFVVATYTQVVNADSSPASSFAYGAFMSASHWLWFSLVALFFSTATLRAWMLRQQRRIDRLIGVALIGLGASLVLSAVSPG